jgi:hypothetical protein
VDAPPARGCSTAFSLARDYRSRLSFSVSHLETLMFAMNLMAVRAPAPKSPASR